MREGILHCPSPDCRLEFPILDGVPVIVPDVAAYLSANLAHVMARDDLPATLESLIGDAAGPGSPFDTTRLHLSSYVRDHYGRHDPDEPREGADTPGATVRCLEAGLALLGEARFAGPALDIGCACGGATHALAERMDGLVLPGTPLGVTPMHMPFEG
ncbi:MAG TPA: hypothetical protein VD970_07120, partial [Acetobacteraceae bacterium]|nr:hypothetical protein [Acetobacteraceae bacterium]